MHQPAPLEKQGAKDVTTQAWVETVIMTSCFDPGKSIRETTGDDIFINQPSPVQANDTQPRWETEARTEPTGPEGVGPISPDWMVSLDHQHAGSVLTGAPPIQCHSFCLLAVLGSLTERWPS